MDENTNSDQEELRLKKLYSYSILDTQEESFYTQIGKIAALTCQTPTAIVSFLDRNKVFFKAKIGMLNPKILMEAPRLGSFTDYVISSPSDFTMIEDTDCVSDGLSGLVLTSGKFFAGVPIVCDGFRIGSLCVVDKKPNTLNEIQIETLKALSEQVSNLLEKRKKNRLLVIQKEDSESKLFDVLDSVDAIFWSASLNMVQANYISPAIFKLTGYRAYDIKAAWSSFAHPDDADTIYKFRQMIKTEGRAETTFRVIKSNGEIIHLQARGKTIYDKMGNPSHIDGVAFDVTAIKTAEQTILEQKNSIIMASKLSALGELSTSIAHEIKNPLGIIQNCAGYLSLQAESSPTLDSSVVSDSVEKIEKTVDRISKIIRSLRNFARDGSQDEKTPISINSVIEEVYDLCNSRFKNSGVELKLDANSSDFIIDCRPSQIYQVLVNLINNSFDAVEFLDEKWVKLSAVVSKNNTVEISVTDSGSGISEAAYIKIFEPFFTTKDIGKGTGLGLSISKKIVSDHGGTLSLDRSCKNTKFVVTLPISDE